ncbi:tRNA 2'-phosphotransferase [Penicillium riverlandense]|uniref:tRNA 2'-phosphotransferase n=1 Tax=Penicillium riverlandense TaxID=1903569 RepID=UPI00254965BB|nr:tRNA 2'-phosphotransferase [Penicillium riverlandense]KAJ5808698.1 tRNA 2'-phosphotransferase [Penicillium riverlandense]
MPNPKDKRARQPPSRDVQISKALSHLLRHAAEKEGVKMTAQGYANVSDVLNWRKLKSLKTTFPEILHAVASSDKQRFALLHIPSAESSNTTKEEETQGPTPSAIDSASTTEAQQTATSTALSVTDTNPSHFLIRATQGHSIKSVEAASFLEPLSLDDESKLPTTVVHGTFHAAWPLILKSGGLRCMKRNHVHFATGPHLDDVLSDPTDRTVHHSKDQEDQKDDSQKEKAKATNEEKDREGQVISGMRRDAQVLIYMNLRKALAAGVPFWRSENGVILSEGVSVNGEQLVSLEFVNVVVERKMGLGKIWEGGRVVKELPANLKRR